MLSDFHHLRLIDLTKLVFGFAFLLTACGAPQGATHAAPDGAVRGFIGELQDGDARGTEDWVLPSQRADFAGALGNFANVHVTVHAQLSNDFAVTKVVMDTADNHQATVKTSGTIQICGTGTLENQQQFSQCSSLGSKPSATEFHCVQINNQWYIDVRSLSDLATGPTAQ